MTSVRGVVLMAYGTPATPDDIEAYYTHIRRDRPPTPELLDDLRRRYDAIGGISPLRERTEAQRAGISTVLGDGWDVRLGMKHAAPFIEDAVAGFAADGVTELVALVLAPHYSRLSVEEYLERARDAAAEHGLTIVRAVEHWHDEPVYLDLLAERVQAHLDWMPAATKLLVTAHSLPARILAEGDPYPDQLRATAEALAARSGLNQWAGFTVAWQSAGRTHEPWMGPDVLEVIRELAATGRAEGVLVCPAGFVSDHLEVLYDL
ncbi:MAG: ferrochelatase, partial [Actinomycetota bacterium]